MSLSLAQYYKNGSGWELATLDDSELNEVYKTIRQRNKEIFDECLTDAAESLRRYQTPYSNSLQSVVSVAQQLFERRAIHISVILDAVLKQKVFELRRNGAHENA